MSIASPEAETLTTKQRVFMGVFGILSVLLAALVVFYFTPAEETSEALPGQYISRQCTRIGWVVTPESIGSPIKGK